MKNILSLIFISLILSSIQACAPVLVVGTVAGAGAKVAADRRQPEKIIEDNAVEIQATDYIYSHETFGKEVHIEVTSFNGTVLLTGEAPKASYKHEIVQHIGKMRAVDKVIDNIQVKEVSSFNDRSNDFWISSKVSSNLIVHRGLLTRTKVITSDSTVYLLGLVNNNEAQEIISIVNQVEDIKEIVPLFESLDGSLDSSLRVSSRISQNKQIEKQKAEEQKLQEEDEIIVQPYVLQPPIRLSDGG